MNATLPPPLPDVPPRAPDGLPPLSAVDLGAIPFARLAGPVPAPFAARARPAHAPVRRSTRLFLHAALPLVLLASLLLLMKQYGSGTHFRHEATHRMIRGFDLMVFVAVCAAALLPIAITFCCTVRRLRRRDRRTAA